MLLTDLHRAENLTPAEEKLADYIMKHAKEASSLTARELAQKAFVSAPTVIRLAQKLGYEKFSQFREAIALSATYTFLDLANINLDMPFTEEDSTQDLIDNFARLAAGSIVACQEHASAARIDAVCELLSRGHCLDIYAAGMSLDMARPFASKLNQIGYLTNIIKGNSEQEARSTLSTPKQVGMIISYSGQTKKLIFVARNLQQAGTPIIVITGNKDSVLLKYATCSIILEGGESLAMRYKINTFSVLYGLHYLLDVVYAVLFNRNHSENCSRIAKVAAQQFQ